MSKEKDGLRERKRKETLRRIADASLKLFIAQGFEETTLDEIAEAAGISRRGFFHYYKSKEEILHVWLGDGMAAAVKPAILDEFKQESPLHTVRNSLLKIVTRLETPESLAIDRLLQSTESLKNRKQILYVEMEQGAYEALCLLYPGKKDRPHLRTIAMVSIGALRLALDRWRNGKAKRRAAEHVEHEFLELERVGSGY
jgi:AcrR family transcriptional regulator